jgi:uncharacterized protein YbcI
MADSRLPRGLPGCSPANAGCQVSNDNVAFSATGVQFASDRKDGRLELRVASIMPLFKTQGEIESAVCDGIARFEQEYIGRGPKGARAHLIGDLLVVRLRGVLTSAEQQLAKSLPAEKGRDLLKGVRTHLIETGRPELEAMILKISGVKVLSMHHDISTATGEEIIAFTLTESPIVRARGHGPARMGSIAVPPRPGGVRA